MAKLLMDDLELYRQFVDDKATENSSDLLPNAGEFHAAIAMSKLFDKTKDHIRMVVNNFDKKVCDQSNYLGSLEKCIDNNIPIDVIILKDPDLDSKAYKLLLQKQADKKPIKIKRASDSFIKRLSGDGKEKNFSVFDNDKFRFEKDSEKYLAWFSFNGEGLCERL